MGQKLLSLFQERRRKVALFDTDPVGEGLDQSDHLFVHLCWGRIALPSPGNRGRWGRGVGVEGASQRRRQQNGAGTSIAQRSSLRLPQSLRQSRCEDNRAHCAFLNSGIRVWEVATIVSHVVESAPSVRSRGTPPKARSFECRHYPVQSGLSQHDSAHQRSAERSWSPRTTAPRGWPTLPGLDQSLETEDGIDSAGGCVPQGRCCRRIGCSSESVF